MIEVQKKLKDDPAQRNLPCILRGVHGKTVILFVTPTSGIVLERGNVQGCKVGDFMTNLIPYNKGEWSLEHHEYTLTNQVL